MNYTDTRNYDAMTPAEMVQEITEARKAWQNLSQEVDRLKQQKKVLTAHLRRYRLALDQISNHNEALMNIVTLYSGSLGVENPGD